MLTAHDLAEQHAARSANPERYMLAFAAGLSAAAAGTDTEAEARNLIQPADEAGFIEGLAAHRARTTTSTRHRPDSHRKSTGGNE